MASKALFVFLSILTLNNLLTTSASSSGFSVELIHRDHVKSPLYNPNHSLIDRVHEAIHRSNARAKALNNYFLSKTKPSSFDDDYPFPPDFSPMFPPPSDSPTSSQFPPPSDSPVNSPFPPPSDSPVNSPFPPPSDSPSSPSGNIQTDIIQNSFNYLMSINLGTPAKELIAIADTGSDLIWATCEPCTNCYKQDAPRFNPSDSNSYSDLSCSAKQCTQLPTAQCDSSKCQYLYSYGDGSQTLGNLATETLTFNTTNQSTVNFTQVSFGCSHQANGTFDPHSAGLVGLGGGPLSLVSQLGWAINHRFSYCLVPFNNANVTTSKLSFGSDATVSGADVEVTDMVSDTEQSTFYTVTLDGITVGGNNSLGDFQSTYIIVDSGTTLTYLDQTIVDSLVETLSSTIKLSQVKDDQGLFPLCFDDSSDGPSSDVYPDITLQLGKAKITLKPYNSFIKTQNNVTCLAITAFKGQTPSDKSLSILGNIAQQNFHVGYDLGTRKVTFAPADCTKY